MRTLASSLALPDRAPLPAPRSRVETPHETPGDHVVIGILPDTQFHARYATEEEGTRYRSMFGSEPFDAQTRWLVESREALGVEFVIHLGDIVDQADRPQQWAIADAAMATLERSGLPYAILAGNHDRGASYDEYRSTFPASRAAQQPTFGGSDPTGLHSHHVIDHHGQPFLVIAMSWDVDDAALDWAQGVLDEHQGVPTILATHDNLSTTADGSAPAATAFSELLWDRLIRRNDQILLTLNGHHHGAITCERLNDAGHPVLQILIDPQLTYLGGNGLLGLLDLDLTGAQISLTTLSPWVAEKPAETLRPVDEPVLHGEHTTFTRSFDVSSRIQRLRADGPRHPSPTLAVREWISTVEIPATPSALPPVDEEDYPHVDGTLAHWRPDRSDGVAEVGAVIPDLAGGNHLTRAPLDASAGDAALEDVVFCSDVPAGSAARASVRFHAADRTTGRASWFRTADDASINTATFENGFTLETFIRISETYRPEHNVGMTWLSRAEKCSAPCDDQRGSGGGPALAWSFTGFRELRFAWTPVEPEEGEAALWSGDMGAATAWMHLAAVHDPATGIATLYVDGVPMLRDARGVTGIAPGGGGPWILGAGGTTGRPDLGFVGSLGETRLVEGVLGPDRWLTARAARTERDVGRRRAAIS